MALHCTVSPMGFIARSAARAAGRGIATLTSAAFGLAIITTGVKALLPIAILALLATIIYAAIVIAWRRWQTRPSARRPVTPTAVQVAQRNLAQARREETAAWAELARLEGRPLSSYTAQRNAARARAMQAQSPAAYSNRR
jgi:hypothetical protein